MTNRSKLVRIFVRNIGCIGNEGLTIELDNIVCLVGRNNSGKSTILRAYELAHGATPFSSARDRCQWAPAEEASEVQLEVHIPADTANIDAKWKQPEKDLLIVRSRWLWAPQDFVKVRSTWDPEMVAWAEDGKAGGADNVFKSRLPRPLHIGSLQDADEIERTLLTLALAPLLDAIERERQTENSALATAVDGVLTQVQTLSGSHEAHFNKIADSVGQGFKGIFPKLDVRLNVTTGPWAPDIDKLVKAGSGLLVKDGAADTRISQQGTGARRALFWAMLQVHNQLTREIEAKVAFRKKLVADIKASEKPKKGSEPVNSDELKAKLAALDDGGPVPKDDDDPALPGYLLLIDEPENALHPMAARAAQRHLYSLAESPDWQVMMTTHSPYFINPLEDHTTIVRLERSATDDRAPVVPRTYRSDSATFDAEDKKRLQALQQIDPSLSEIFFGSYPILVEGDTEHAAFISAIVERRHSLIDRVTVVRARGKAILPSLVSVLTHFKIEFGIVHDCDPPFREDGSLNGMWTINKKILESVRAARARGIAVRHRVSVPDFERWMGSEEESKDKPINAYRRIADDDQLNEKIQDLLSDLIDGEKHEVLVGEELMDEAGYLQALKTAVCEWAASNGKGDSIRYAGPA